MAKAKAFVKAAESTSVKWTGPTTGPKAAKKQLVAIVSTDESNAGPAEVAVGAVQAAKALGWKYRVLDGQGTAEGNTNAMNEALALHPTGIFLDSDTASQLKPEIAIAKKDGIPIVGWHVENDPGTFPADDMFYNVESNQTDAATAIADYVIVQSKGKANVAIVTWTAYPIAVYKTQVMRRVIESCDTCKVLSYANYPLTTATTTLPTYITSLLDRYKTGAHPLNYMMFMNDQYAQDSIPALRSAGISTSGAGSVNLVSTGDGTAPAFVRIRQGDQYQVATLPEPVYEDGWEAMDELNRAIKHDKPDPYVTPIHIVVKQDVNSDGGKQNIYNPANGYQKKYERIWGVS
jgi:ribose transport system substrate-binding protein